MEIGSNVPGEHTHFGCLDCLREMSKKTVRPEMTRLAQKGAAGTTEIEIAAPFTARADVPPVERHRNPLVGAGDVRSSG